MLFLLLVSLIWALSFGLIKTYLTNIDAYVVSFIRISLSLFFFLPFLKRNVIAADIQIKLIITGAIQYGMMYVSYIHAFQFLKAYQVALFTIFTPIYVTLINDLFNKRFHSIYLISAFLSVLGTAIVIFQNEKMDRYIWGFLLMQLSNLSFALGQVYYKELMKELKNIPQFRIFGLLYFGAVILTGVSVLMFSNMADINFSASQIYILLFLGVISSGICFFLWNYGATQTNTGNLAVMNNMKIPLAILASVMIFGESADWFRLALGFLLLMGGLIVIQVFRKDYNNIS
jgi:drug/metabolite transporter (DMT)-like permease